MYSSLYSALYSALYSCTQHCIHVLSTVLSTLDKANHNIKSHVHRHTQTHTNTYTLYLSNAGTGRLLSHTRTHTHTYLSQARAAVKSKKHEQTLAALEIERPVWELLRKEKLLTQLLQKRLRKGRWWPFCCPVDTRGMLAINVSTSSPSSLCPSMSWKEVVQSHLRSVHNLYPPTPYLLPYALLSSLLCSLLHSCPTYFPIHCLSMMRTRAHEGGG